MHDPGGPTTQDPVGDAKAWRRLRYASTVEWCKPGSPLAAYAPDTRLIHVPTAFVRYVISDGVFLPDDTEAFPTRAKVDPWDEATAVKGVDYTQADDWSTESSSSDSEGDNASAAPSDRAEEPPGGAAGPSAPAGRRRRRRRGPVSFPALEAAVRAAIAELGGAVVPKLGWTCPTDATWVSQNMACSEGLLCRNPGEVFLLLQASDRVAADIMCRPPLPPPGAPEPAYAPCPGPESLPVLSLRRWMDEIEPYAEFRCFVAGHRLVGASQRHVGEHWPSVWDTRHDVEVALSRFHASAFGPRDGGDPSFPLPDFTYDVYIKPGARAGGGSIWLLDCGAWGEGLCDPLMFDWADLCARARQCPLSEFAAEVSGEGAGASTDGPLLRLLAPDEAPPAVRPSARVLGGAPLDLRETGPGSALDDFIRTLKMKQEREEKAEREAAAAVQAAGGSEAAGGEPAPPDAGGS